MDKIIPLIKSYIETAIRTNDAENCAEALIAVMSKAGYINLSEWLNEEAEGWVVWDNCAHYNGIDCTDSYSQIRKCICPNISCRTERPATRAEALAGKATREGE